MNKVKEILVIVAFSLLCFSLGTSIVINIQKVVLQKKTIESIEKQDEINERISEVLEILEND